MNFTKRESNETSRVFTQRENVQYMWLDTQADSGRDRVAESHPHGSLNCFYWASLLGFLQPIILICLVHSPYLIYLRVLPCCGRILPHTSLPQRHLGRASLNIISSLTSKEPFSAGEVGWGGGVS